MFDLSSAQTNYRGDKAKEMEKLDPYKTNMFKVGVELFKSKIPLNFSLNSQDFNKKTRDGRQDDL